MVRARVLKKLAHHSTVLENALGARPYTCARVCMCAFVGVIKCLVPELARDECGPCKPKPNQRTDVVRARACVKESKVKVYPRTLTRKKQQPEKEIALAAAHQCRRHNKGGSRQSASEPPDDAPIEELVGRKQGHAPNACDTHSFEFEEPTPKPNNMHFQRTI